MMERPSMNEIYEKKKSMQNEIAGALGVWFCVWSVDITIDIFVLCTLSARQIDR